MVKSIDILMVIRWVKQAWEDVTGSTITNCFKHCGIREVQNDDNQDSFACLESDVDCGESVLQELVAAFNTTVTANEYVMADNDLNSCFTFENTDCWREELELMVCEEASVPSSKRSAVIEDSDDEDYPQQKSSIKSIKEALTTANDLLAFLSEHGMEDTTGHMLRVVTNLQGAKIKRETQQTNILQYFNPEDN